MLFIYLLFFIVVVTRETLLIFQFFLLLISFLHHQCQKQSFVLLFGSLNRFNPDQHWSWFDCHRMIVRKCLRNPEIRVLKQSANTKRSSETDTICNDPETCSSLRAVIGVNRKSCLSHRLTSSAYLCFRPSSQSCGFPLN